MAVVQMMNLYSIFYKVSANGSKIFPLRKPHSSFRFQYRLLNMTTVFEIAVYTETQMRIVLHRILKVLDTKTCRAEYKLYYD